MGCHTNSISNESGPRRVSQYAGQAGRVLHRVNRALVSVTTNPMGALAPRSERLLKFPATLRANRLEAGAAFSR